ncbi:MAG: hypothetical protein HQL97_00880 [Magnetococcales bacterium]|nr:hypothetical protein [Magnetococcales bacterium]
MTTPLLSPTFDTFEFIEQLKASGVPEEQAKSHVKLLATVLRQVDLRVDDLATRRDKQVDDRFNSLAERADQQVKGRLDGLATRQEMDFRLAALEANLKRDIEIAKVETVKWVIATGIVILGGVATINRFFPNPSYLPATPAAQVQPYSPPQSPLQPSSAR